MPSNATGNLGTSPATGRKRRRVAMAVFAGLLLLLIADYLCYPHVSSMGGQSINTGENGLWLRYTWYFGKYSDEEIIALAERLRERQIRYAYFHVRSLESDGRLKYRYGEEAQRLTGLLHKHAPELKLLAWVFVGGERFEPFVDLHDPTIRQVAVKEAVWLVSDCGFDGVQWDYEICRSGDTRLITLLQETRDALPEGSVLSACGYPWYPRPVTRWFGWEEAYFARVAAECDQIAVMTYDTGIYLPRAYVWFVREQARRLPRAVTAGNPECHLILGLPTYGKGGRGHHPRAESLALAIKGARAGANHDDPFGIALFADYTTQAREWAVYQRWWAGE